MVENMKKNWLWIASCLACALVFFFIGLSVGKGTASQTTSRGSGTFTGSSTRGGYGGTRSGGGFTSGQITAKDAQSITLQLPNGNSEVVFYSTSTSITKMTATSLTSDDIAVGTQVMIGGTQNSDGSLTAQSIQIRNGAAPSGAGTSQGQ